MAVPMSQMGTLRHRRAEGALTGVAGRGKGALGSTPPVPPTSWVPARGPGPTGALPKAA